MGAFELEKTLKVKRGSPDEGNKLWDVVVRGAGGPDVKYAALMRLQELAAQKNDLFSVLLYAGRIGKDFAIHPLEAKAETLDRVNKTTKSGAMHQAIAEQALKLVPRAEDEEAFEPAFRLVLVGRSAADKAGKQSLVKVAEVREAEVTGARLDLSDLEEALGVLARDPEDAGANLKVGRFRCLYQDDWDEALPRLARGSDEVLRTLAQKDLANPAEPEARKELGDGWWAAGEREKDSRPGRLAFGRRALHWYALALPKLTRGAGEVKKRVDTFSLEIPDVRDPWRHMDVSEGTVESDHVHLDAEKCLLTRRPRAGAVEITVVARTKKNNIRLTAGDGAMALFNWEGPGGGMVFRRPDNPDADGRGRLVGKVAGTKARNLDPNKLYTLRWQLTPGGMKVWVNDELVFEKEEPYDLSAPQPVGVCSSDSAIDVKSVSVKPFFSAPGDKQGAEK
jgi:hypothetical protein